MKILRLGKYYYLKFTRLKGDPHSLAMGTAIGVFIGLTPTIPFHTVTILLITMVTRSSAIAGVLVSWIVCNPLTYIPIYYFSLVIGNHTTPFTLSWLKVKNTMNALVSEQNVMQSLHDLADLGMETIAVMLFGGVIFALPFAIASYYLSLHLFGKIRQKKRHGKMTTDNS